jgi:hypothetical protein
MNKQMSIFIMALIVASGLSFYGGMKYNQKQFTTERTANRAQFGGGGNGARGLRGGAGGSFAAGEVIAKDDKSITIKLRDGGSKIVFLSGSTEVMKSSQGSAQDILVGAQINANGTTNTDGSVTAQMIQIRPLTTNQ